MDFLKKNRFRVAAVLVIILGIVIAFITWGYLHPLPETTDFKSSTFSFTYPRTYFAKEYAAGVVSIGIGNDETIVPYIEVSRYKSDPESAQPKSFDEFIKRQAGALCGADGPIESVMCTQVGETPYTNANGEDGVKLDLTLVRKNLKTATTSTSTYGPMYVFNVTPKPTADSPLHYAAVFIYPSLSAFLHGTTTPELEQQIVSTFKVPGGVQRGVK